MKLTRLVLFLMMFLLMTAVAWGLSNITGKWHGSSTVLEIDAKHFIDANALEMFVTNVGNFAYDKTASRGRNDGLYFPRGTSLHCIYDAGIWIGAKVHDSTRIAVAEYSTEFTTGPMKEGKAQSDRGEFKVYKIKRGDDATNPDYANWPTNHGAPVDSAGKPAIQGDQMTWSVCNDADKARHANNAGKTDPLGVEIQQSTFAYARGGPLGNAIYLKFKIINKGFNRLDSTYISIWSDPDLGEESDDKVGCDTALSLGYCYNDGADPLYGAAPPAVGFDFLQGPKDSTGLLRDTANVSGVKYPYWKNLPMTSFNRYINGTDPQSRAQTYSYMKGLNSDGTPVIDPTTNQVSKFVTSGDPVTGTGWLDPSPADKRLMMNTGPFTMNPGDTQEVVAAVIVGQGTDPINSISALKFNDKGVQAVFDLNFRIPNPPPSPKVWARGIDEGIDLTWNDTSVVSKPEINDFLDQEFHFEGFNVYQGVSPYGPWSKFATYDRDDDDSLVALIYGDVVDPAAGGTQRVILQKGSNSGLNYHLSLSRSKLDGTRFANNQPYYFAVTAYSYDYRHFLRFYDPASNFLGFITETLESPIVSYEVRPLTFQGTFVDTASHQGNSDGRVVVEYIHPEQVTGHDYEVSFFSDASGTSYWKLTDKTLNKIVLDSVTNQADNYRDPIVDGMMVRVMGPSPGVKSIAEILNGTGVVDPPDNVFMSRNSTSEWYMDPLGDQTISRYVWASPTSDDYEIRLMPEANQYCWDFFGPDQSADYASVNPFQVPIQVWNIGDPNNPADDKQITFLLLDDSGVSGKFDWGDGLYFEDIPYASVDWTGAGVTDGLYDPDGNLLSYRRFRFFNLTDPPTGDYPTPGTVVRITTNKPNTSLDTYAFKSIKPGSTDGTFVKNTLDNVKTVPNPYYDFYNEETNQFHRIVKFINLPAVEMKIRVFNVAGDLIRTMDRTDIYNPEFVWDLKTDRGLWVASGIYIWLIEAQGLGTRYGKMAIFTEVEQLNTF